MLYTELKLGSEEFKLRLGARDIVNLEKKLGANPLDMFMQIEQGKLPKLEAVLLVIQYSMSKYHNGMTLDKVYDLYDEYTAEGNTFMDLIPSLIEIFKVSGFFKNEVTSEDKSPN